MTNKEAIYLLRNTAWLAPSLEPIDEAIDMACEALRKTEHSSEKQNNCDTCKFELYCPEMRDGCCERDSHYEPKDEPQTEYERASEQREYDILYEPTYDVDNGSMRVEDEQSGKE